jgi:hypothetical protein
VKVLNVDPVIVTRRLTVVRVRMRVRCGEVAVRVWMTVLEWVALTAHL